MNVKEDQDQWEADNAAFVREATRRAGLSRTCEEKVQTSFHGFKELDEKGKLTRLEILALLRKNLPTREELDEYQKNMSGERDLRKLEVVRSLVKAIETDDVDIAQEIFDQFKAAHFLLERSRQGEEIDWYDWKLSGIDIFLSPPGRTGDLSNSLHEILNFVSPIFALSHYKYQNYDPLVMKHIVSRILGTTGLHDLIDNVVNPVVGVRQRLKLLGELMSKRAKGDYGDGIKAIRETLA